MHLIVRNYSRNPIPVDLFLVLCDTVEEYINRRRQTVANYIRDRPIFDLCMEGERQRGTHPHKWWWDQEVNVDLESEEDSSSVVSGDH